MEQSFIAPAKVNLNLHITGRNDAGYHLLDSLMAFTEWGDIITIRNSSDYRLTASGPCVGTIPLDETNLVTRAVNIMADTCKKRPGVHIHIEKNIPIGAGLGGGSSDAATVMHALNKRWNAGLTIDTLCTIAAPLGAEMTVCLHQKAARVTGIGETVIPVKSSIRHPILIVWPDQPLLTKDVFDQYRNNHYPFNAPLPAFTGEIAPLKHETCNALQPAAIELCPDIQDILNQIGSTNGCILSRMSGSGSACFGIFKDEISRNNAAANFKNVATTWLTI